MSTSSEPQAACPPPLMWQDVRREYLAQSELRTLRAAHGEVSVRVLGSGRPLYLLPGLTSPAELYGLLVWLLRDDFQCVTVEPTVGCTLTETGRRRALRPATPSMTDYVELIWAAADDLKHDAISIFGANFGAAWGLTAAEQAPDRVAQLMLLQGFAHRRLSVAERGLKWWCGFSRKTLSSLPGRAFLQTQNHLRWFPPFDETRWRYYLDTTGEMPLKELARRAEAVRRFDLRSALPLIATPALLIRTEGEGQLAAQCQEDLASALPNARVEWLHNSGQLTYLTHPHRLAKLIREFCGVTEI